MLSSFNTELTNLETFAVNVIKCGKIPRHIAFVMDGNRRYAKLANEENPHKSGESKSLKILDWCSFIGVKEVSLYAFSILNFRRSKDELDAFMNLIKEILINLNEKLERFKTTGLRIRVLGNLELLNEDLRKLSGQIVMATKNNNKITVNIIASYTFSDEITECVKTVADGVQKGKINVEDIDELLLYKNLYTNFDHPPEMLVRTSGATRLSDFLNWQLGVGNAKIHFIEELWPAVSLWRLLLLVLDYQLSLYGKPKLDFKLKGKENEKNEIFLKEVADKRLSVYEAYRNM